ncbi:mannosyltransferase [Novosphingobium sp.]|uniref:mannosyltransferase n=1 Tax=Novosphingobium sp. TaxID=1874826 RepID=UPI003342A850
MRATRLLPVGLILVLAVALALRIALASRMTVLHADEVWQYLEPGYGLVTGNWVRAWEFKAGIRGWFVPLLLAAPIALGQALAPDSQLHVYLVRGLLAVLSLGIPVAWYDLARPLGRRHALIAAWVAAIWCEVFFFGTRPSAEAISLSLLFPAMALAQRLRREPRNTVGIALGLLLALSFVVRFHYLPAIGLIGLWGVGKTPRRTVPLMMAGVAAGLALGGLCDVVTGHPPLLWIWRSIAFNVVQGGSDLFGTQPPWWFVTYQLQTWSWASLAIVPLMLVGARRQPMLLAIALAVYLPHSLIAHKEYRFVILGTTTLVLLAAIGSVDVWAALERRFNVRHKWLKQGGLALLALGWLGLDLVVALSAIFAVLWTQGDDAFTTLVIAGEQPGICGLAMFNQPAHPALAMSLFNRKVPALLFDGPDAQDEARAVAGRFNVAITAQLSGAELPPGYHLVRCWAQEDFDIQDRDQCVFARSGGCSGSVGDFDYQTAMERRGK